MKIRKLRIKNFRAISSETTINLNDFNVIVGRNDAGKSTILKALDLLLNESKFIPEYLNLDADSDVVEITAYIDPQGQEIVIDENIATTFEAEEITDDTGLVVVKKTWDAGRSSRITPDTYIIRRKYLENDFLLESEPGLLRICRDLGIETRKANNEEFNNVEKRTKLRDHHQQNGVQHEYVEEKIPTSGTSRLRNIGKALKESLPRFEYFKADTSLSETDTSIQNFFKKLAEKTFEEEIDREAVEGMVRTTLEKVLTKITSKINEIVPEEEQIEPDVRFDWTKLVQTSFKSKGQNGEIPLSSRGDGFRRITMMAYFEYLAEQGKSEKQNILFGFEEPETFLHPRAQENLYDKLEGLCRNDYQVVVSTHSPIIVDQTVPDNLMHVHRSGGSYVVEQQITNIEEIARDLGITADNQFIQLFERARFLLLVEGIGDVKAFEHVANVYKANNLITDDFSDLNVVTIPIGGCGSVKHWVNLDLLRSLNRPYFIVQDSDLTAPTATCENRNNLISYGLAELSDFYILKKRETENYIPCSALNRLVSNANISYGDFDDVKLICRRHQFSGRLGGKNILERHFGNLTFQEIRSTFFDGSEDEFLIIYETIRRKLNV